MTEQMRTRPRFKTLAGVLLIVVYLVAYCLIVMALIATWMVDKPIAVQTIFYAIAGVAWLLPMGMLLRWMARD